MKRTTRKRKSRKQRGKWSHGWGHKKKHRGKGSRGGKGMAGSGKRADTKKPTIINLYGNAYFGRHGFIVPHRKHVEAINLKDLDVLIKYHGLKGDVNLTTLGYGKLLATGTLSQPMKITVAHASKQAIEKVKSAGGDVILSA